MKCYHGVSPAPSLILAFGIHPVQHDIYTYLVHALFLLYSRQIYFIYSAARNISLGSIRIVVSQ